ncbi:uncharacterized protein EV154DRAFT_601816 [Mucor mucedo]|uniref:uncharacterized protein n=1 Tax=Mucor mucedo TaxID=29922 RepID=UPI00221FF038|nr:uncharacterized protein EV154DRAFT_601816 [Mucor mucedo]KAI7892295.1 hypothetical protein EV154DRAFT_601816 [Mucor mucedo]
MLRVYSILYIEKLWTVGASPALKGVESSHSSIMEVEIPVPVEELSVEQMSVEQMSVEEISIFENEIIESPVHLDGVPEEEEEEEDRQDEEDEEEEEEAKKDKEEIENKFGGYTLESMETEQVTSSNEEEQVQDTRRHSKVTFEEPTHDEHIVRSLDIKPEDEHHAAIFESTISEEYDVSSHDEEEVADASLSSNSSSIVPPHTPISTQTSANSTDKPTSPRTTSLLRRETTKLNSRRKSLTNKLKRVLTVKSGATNKRNSVSLE